MLIQLGRIFSRFRRDRRGTAAIEFGAGAMFLIVGVLNAVDMGLYEYERMEVENAGRAGAQAAWKSCNDSSLLPATVNCSGLSTAVGVAIQGTTLRTAVSLASGYPAEGYYCVNGSGALELVGSLSSEPADCSAAGNPNASPGDYIQVSVTYAYAPLFGLSVMTAWGVSSINAVTWMRLD